MWPALVQAECSPGSCVCCRSFTKRRDSWAGMHKPKLEQELARGTHTREKGQPTNAGQQTASRPYTSHISLLYDCSLQSLVSSFDPWY